MYIKYKLYLLCSTILYEQFLNFSVRRFPKRSFLINILKNRWKKGIFMFLEFGFAPLASSTLTHSMFPSSAALWRGVSPLKQANRN